MKKLIFILFFALPILINAQKQLPSPKWTVEDSQLSMVNEINNRLLNYSIDFTLKSLDSSHANYVFNFTNAKNDSLVIYYKYNRFLSFDKRVIFDWGVKGSDSIVIEIFNNYFGTKFKIVTDLDDANGWVYSYKGVNYKLNVVSGIGNDGRHNGIMSWSPDKQIN